MAHSEAPDGQSPNSADCGYCSPGPGIHMGLKALVLCSDEKIVRVLRRVLGDLDIEVELCPTAEAALRKLTRTNQSQAKERNQVSARRGR